MPVSWLEGFSYCKRKWFLENVLRIRRPPKEALLCGSIKHAVLDSLKKAEQGIVCRLRMGFRFDELASMYKRVLHAILRKEFVERAQQFERLGIDRAALYGKIASRLEKEAALRVQHIYDFSKKSRLSGYALWKALSPKLLSEMVLESRALGLKGRLDLLEMYDDKLIPVEIKSGSAPAEGTWRGHRLQLGAYALLVEERFKQGVDEGYVYYVDCNARRKIVINPFLREEVLNTVVEINEIINTRKIPKAVGGRRCEACPLRRNCELIKR